MKKELKGLGSKVAIHCVTPEEYTQVLDLIPMDAAKRKSMDFGFRQYGNNVCVGIYREDFGFGTTDFWKSEGCSIIPASDFIAMNTSLEASPTWTFKTDDNLKSFVAGFLSGNFANFEEYVEMIRKPAFELVTADNVRVTDPEQIVYWVSSSVSKGKASDMKQWGCLCWASESAALNHRRHNTPAIKLSDMTLFAETYILSKEEAENLVNERINGK